MRQFSGVKNWLIGGWLVALSIYQLYTAMFGILQPRPQRGIHLMFLLPAAFILFPAVKKDIVDNKVPIYDLVCAGLALLPPIYLIINNSP